MKELLLSTHFLSLESSSIKIRIKPKLKIIGFHRFDISSNHVNPNDIVELIVRINIILKLFLKRFGLYSIKSINLLEFKKKNKRKI